MAIFKSKPTQFHRSRLVHCRFRYVKYVGIAPCLPRWGAHYIRSFAWPDGSHYICRLDYHAHWYQMRNARLCEWLSLEMLMSVDSEGPMVSRIRSRDFTWLRMLHCKLKLQCSLHALIFVILYFARLDILICLPFWTFYSDPTRSSPRLELVHNLYSL